MRLTRLLLAAAFPALGLASLAHAGAQAYEPLAASVQAALHAAVSDHAAPEPEFPSLAEKQSWLAEMSQRLARRMPDRTQRRDLIKTVYYEAKRAGLDPQRVLGLIQVESGFRKYAISSVGARGYMQIMPFWSRTIGTGDPASLFHMQTNIRFGCVILRHYLDMERGNLFMALGRYNGSRGRAEYPNMVTAAWRGWKLPEGGTQVADAGTAAARR